jgi:ABC-2 type transport system ATP-binding protein
VTDALSIRGLRHRFGEREVLAGLDLDVRRGEILGLLGPNGSGKSTALAILAGLLPRQGGEITWNGRRLRAADRELRAELGVVFQRAAIDPKLTARQNLHLAARLQGLPRSVGRARSVELLAAAGLLDRADDVTGTFSGGMRRRLDLVRALIHEPRLLVMDEPTSGLDEASFRETWDRLAALRAGRDLTVLVATHRPDEAERCDRLAVLQRGRVERVATPRELQVLVAKDVVVLEGPEPALLHDAIRERFGLESLTDEHRVLVESDKGHELIPRLVEGLAGLRIDAVSLRRPTLADAFLKITGRQLAADEPPEAAA